MARESDALVPTIDVLKAQATKEEDRIRIFEEINRNLWDRCRAETAR